MTGLQMLEGFFRNSKIPRKSEVATQEIAWNVATTGLKKAELDRLNDVHQQSSKCPDCGNGPLEVGVDDFLTNRKTCSRCGNKFQFSTIHGFGLGIIGRVQVGEKPLPPILVHRSEKS